MSFSLCIKTKQNKNLRTRIPSKLLWFLFLDKNIGIFKIPNVKSCQKVGLLVFIFASWMTEHQAVASQINKKVQGFPGGTVVKNPPANAGDTGSSPGLGRSHMPRSNWAREPQLLSLHVWSLCSATREATIVTGPHTRMKRDPCLLQLEKTLAQKQRPNTGKKIKKN